jgi:hypothetical protein
MTPQEDSTYDTLAHCCILMIAMLIVVAEAVQPYSSAPGGAPEPCPCRYVGP